MYLPGADALWRGTEVRDYEAEVAGMFAGRRNCMKKGDFAGIAQHAYSVAQREGFFADAPVGVAAGGSFYRLQADGSIDIEPLTLQHRQRGQIVGEPDFISASPLLDRFIGETFHEGDTPEGRAAAQAQTDFVQEVAGAVLFGLMAPYQKAVLFYGPGRAGKGTLTRLLEVLVPPELRTAATPFAWDSEYHLAALQGKRLNIVGELPQDVPIPAAIFKTVTGGDLLSGRHPAGRPFTFKNEAAHVYSSNHMITTRDHSDAFFSRWLIVDFKNSRLQSGAAIEADLDAKIIEQELPQLLGWAMLGAVRLQKRRRFVATPQHDALMSKWRKSTNSVLEFLQDAEAVTLGAVERDAAPRRRDVYEAYRLWAVGCNRKPMALQRFNEELDAPHVARLGVSVRRDTTRREVVEGVRFARVAEAAADMRKEEWT
jgi:putative DNA primase/helicase